VQLRTSETRCFEATDIELFPLPLLSMYLKPI